MSPECQVRESVAHVSGRASTAVGAPFTLNVIDVAHDGTRKRSGNATGDAIVTVSFVESPSG